MCNHQFSWKRTYKSLFESRTIHCGEYGTELKATNLGKLTALVIIPMLLKGNVIFKENSAFYFAINLGVMNL